MTYQHTSIWLVIRYNPCEMQARCDEVPSDSRYTGLPLMGLRMGQCVLTVSDVTVLLWPGGGMSKNVWVHGLYIHAPLFTLAPTIVVAASNNKSRLWLTDTSIQGGTGFEDGGTRFGNKSTSALFAVGVFLYVSAYRSIALVGSSLSPL
jgi:hypothetical protein